MLRELKFTMKLAPFNECLLFVKVLKSFTIVYASNVKHYTEGYVI